ncbi:flagellar biosynthesis regulator FlaF [uncultured Roseovarius sp.]|uniref:flagellar biosynthesis regulator FlaF n=1 Tax=uncultured Roseovarius sp. TaxID=293344 RepID=UPI002633CEAF|nr:flagellar biosynthesis regulator FlaF [uncultured Roseovarius sp.]
MNATLLAQNAYRTQAQTIRTERGLEYDAIARITHNLCMAARDGRDNMIAVARAIHDNRRLWTILATDVADPENPLPNALRAQIIYLAEYTHHHSSKVLRDAAPIAPLIEVNTAIMRGLGERRSTS